MDQLEQLLFPVPTPDDEETVEPKFDNIFIEDYC